MKKIIILLIIFFINFPVYANELQFNGFISQGYFITTGNNYLDPDSKTGTFNLTETGLAFLKPLNNSMHVGAQLYAHRLGDYGNLEPIIDWAYFNYRVNNFGFRVGKYKIPLGFYNEIHDYSFLRNQVFLPRSVYIPQLREIVIGSIGILHFGTVYNDSLGLLKYNVFFGSYDFNEKNNLIYKEYRENEFRLNDINKNNSIGVDFKWDIMETNFTIGYSYIQLELTFNMTPFGQTLNNFEYIFQQPVTGYQVNIDTFIIDIFSLKYSKDFFSITTEYMRQYSKNGNFNQSVFLSNNKVNLPVDNWNDYYGFYINAEYEFKYNHIFSLSYQYTKDKRNQNPNQTMDTYGISYRYNINSYWDIKLEALFNKGTFGIYEFENPYGIKDRWNLYAIKTTLHF